MPFPYHEVPVLYQKSAFYYKILSLRASDYEIRAMHTRGA